MAKIEDGYNEKIVNTIKSCEKLSLELLSLDIKEYYENEFTEELFERNNVRGNIRKVSFKEILEADISPVFNGFNVVLTSLENRIQILKMGIYEDDKTEDEENKKFIRNMIEHAFAHACKWLS